MLGPLSAGLVLLDRPDPQLDIQCRRFLGDYLAATRRRGPAACLGPGPREFRTCPKWPGQRLSAYSSGGGAARNAASLMPAPGSWMPTSEKVITLKACQSLVTRLVLDNATAGLTLGQAVFTSM